MLETLGYIAAVGMGLSLGMIGGGGSILTVPILVYLFKIDPVLATAYSLFIVGATSLFGSFSHMRLGNIHWRTAIVFGIPSVVSVFLTRFYLVPAIPDPLFETGAYTISKPTGLLILFAIIMLAASYSMIRTQNPVKSDWKEEVKYNYAMIIAEGAIVGIVTGLVGAGGGFLIIPALVLLARLPMKKAVGTSLIIISLKSLIGFMGDLSGDKIINWTFMITFTAIAVAGILTGSYLSSKISNEKLKPAFGWFVLLMGIYILIKETMFK